MAQMDAAILVVSVMDDLNTKALEQFLAAKQIRNLSTIILYINQYDRLDEEEDSFDLFMMDLQTTLEKLEIYDLVAASFVGSAKSAEENPCGPDGDLIIKMMETIDKIRLPERRKQYSFYMPVYKNYRTPDGRTVVTGVVERGVVNVGDTVNVFGYSDEVFSGSVMKIECAHRPRETAEAGDSVGILLRGRFPSKIRSGQIVTTADSCSLSRKLLIRFYFLTKEEGGRFRPIYPGAEVRIHCGLITVNAVLGALNSRSVYYPGDNTTIPIELTEPAAIYEGYKVILRECGRTIAIGRVTESE